MHQERVISLQYSTPGKQLRLRNLTGYDELSVNDTGTLAAINLINRLLSLDTQTTRAEQLVTADRDLVLADIYLQVFGNYIEGQAKCKQCGDRFELSFHLSQLQAYLQESKQLLAAENGEYTFDEYCFRLPTGVDEMAVANLPAEEAIDHLLKLCVTKGGMVADDKIQEAMSRIAPVLQTEIKTACPHCNAEQQTRFDIQSYLLAKIKSEQKSLLREVHCLALTYHWSHREIMELPRGLRKKYVLLAQEGSIVH